MGGWVLGAVLLTACSVPNRIEHPRLPALLSPEVDSVVVVPFERAPGVELAPVELALFAQFLGQALQAREQLRIYEQPPTRLPNTVRVAGRLEALDVNERSGDGLQLRTVDLVVELQVLPADGEAPLFTLRRRTARQEVYAGEPMSALALDLEDAVVEVTGQLAQALAPLPTPVAVALRTGAEDDAHASMAAGNAAAAAGSYDRARLHWQAVLFDPMPEAVERRYRIGPGVLNRLRAEGVAPDVVRRLEPLAVQDAASLVDFRRAMRAALDDVRTDEGRILTLADTRFASASENLAAAHANLAALSALERRGDLAAYHWARAWAHDPAPELLERWRELQDARNALPRGIEAEDALRLYLRIPAPATAAVRPGAFDRGLLPPSAFAEVEAEGAEPLTALRADTGGPAPQTSDDSILGRAAGSGPSAATGTTDGTVPAEPTEAAPANR